MSVLAAALLLAHPVSAQQAGTFWEAGVHTTATAVVDGPVGLVAGPRLGVRTLGSTRVAVSLGAGVRDGEGSARGTLSLEYLLAPRAAGRLGVYVGGGLVGVLGNGNGGYLLAYLGAEQSPGRRGGWALEAGLGGGFRVRLAYHWRWLPRGWLAER
ncbi:MAG: hypothetical protein ACRENB_07410 [Gemmatimonadales bacterium]